MSKNAIKYEYTEGCPNDIIGVYSQQSYKDKNDVLNAATYGKVKVEHGDIDLILKVVTYDKVIDKSGNIVERRDVKTRKDEGITH